MMAKKRLRIAMIAPLAERVPPKKYGGTERVISSLTEELVKRGHKVTLFASGDSITRAKLVSVFPKGLREAKIRDPHGMNEWALLHLTTAYMRQEEFDIIHDHNSVFGLPFSQFSTTPVVITIHGAINSNNRRLYETVKNPKLVTISKAQSAPFPQINIFENVYNGVVSKRFPFGKKPNGYLLYVGRISMEKGVHLAIDAAINTNLRLIIAAKLDTADKKYFQEFVEPRLSEEQVKWIGEVNETGRNNLMSKAYCLLHPVTWREPFGLSIVEAMACGCPVIAFNKGSIPELVHHGKTGFVVEDLDEMETAISKIREIKRSDCRKHALQNFNVKLMTDRYEEVYMRAVKEAD